MTKFEIVLENLYLKRKEESLLDILISNLNKFSIVRRIYQYYLNEKNNKHCENAWPLQVQINGKMCKVL